MPKVFSFFLFFLLYRKYISILFITSEVSFGATCLGFLGEFYLDYNS